MSPQKLPNLEMAKYNRDDVQHRAKGCSIDNRGFRYIAGVVLAISTLIAVSTLNLGCGNQGSAAAVSEIEQNGFKSLGDVETYHVIVETTSPLYPQYIYEKEVWVKGPGMYKEVAKSSRDESRGIPPTESTYIFNGRTSVSVGEVNLQVDYNCPPFDSYGDFDFPYDISNKLESLLEVDGIEILGSEDIRGREAYKIELNYSGEVLVDEASNPTQREIVWVDKTNSVVLREELYEGGELAGLVDVVSYEVNADIPDSLFNIDVAAEKEGITHVEERDEGYRDIALEQVQEYCDIVPLLPAYVPEGFVPSATGWRDPSASGMSRDLPPELAPIWYKPFYTTYSDGSITAIAICEAKRYDTDLPDEYSLGVEPELIMTVKSVEMSGGRTGYYEIEMQTLSFFIDDTKVRIKADLPLDELVQIAESMW